MLGDQGLLAGAAPGGVIVDFSTIDTATTTEWRLARLLLRTALAGCAGDRRHRGARLAPFLVLRGEKPVLNEALPRCRLWGHHHPGPVGSGQRAKAVNQAFVAGSYAAGAEGRPWRKAGLPTVELVEALKMGPQVLGPCAIGTGMPQGISFGFQIAIAVGFAIAQAEAQARGLQLPVTDPLR